MEKLFRLVLALALTQLIACSSWLPEETVKLEEHKVKFEDIKAKFDNVKEDRTTSAELRAMGFDPYMANNVTILSYSDIVPKFMPNSSIQLSQVPLGIQKCILATDRCSPFVMMFEETKGKRIGNATADLFGFVRTVELTGWRASMLFVVLDDVVVYKSFSGEPNVYSHTKQKKPLGPLQEIGGSALKSVVVP